MVFIIFVVIFSLNIVKILEDRAIGLGDYRKIQNIVVYLWYEEAL